MRLFFAIPLPVNIKAELTAQTERLAAALPPVKWVETENLHLTVQFLGELSTDHVPELISAAQTALQAAGPFSLQLERFGIFPEQHPRILYVTLSSEKLQSLVIEFRNNLNKLPFITAERKKFLPHITLARIKEQLPEKAVTLIRQTEYHASCTIREIQLISSKLTARGPRYEIIKTFTLNA